MKVKKIKFDKLRPVYFGWNAIAVFEEETGIAFAEMGEAMSNFKAKDLIAFVYAGLVGGANKNKVEIDFSLNDVGDWLDEVEDLEKIFEAYMQCMPMTENKKQGKKKA